MRLDIVALRNPQILRLFAAQFLSQICDKLMLIGSMWAITVHFNPKAAPWFLAIGALPHLFLTHLAPLWIERRGPLRTVVDADWARGILLLLSLSFFTPSSGGEFNFFQLGILFALNFLMNLFGAFFNPAVLILPTKMTHDKALCQKATAMVETCFSLSSVLAPMFSVALYSLAGLKGLIGVNAISYFVAAYIEQGIQILPDPSFEMPIQRLVTLSEIGKRDPFIPYALGGFFILNLFLGPVLVFIPLFARYIYAGSLTMVGYMETALGLGTLFGSFILTIYHVKQGLISKIATLLILDCIAYVAFSMSTRLWLGVTALATMGLALALANILVIGLFQTRALSQELPKIMSWVNVISVATLPLSMGCLGLVLNKTGIGAVSHIAIILSSSSLGIFILILLFPIAFPARFVKAVSL